MEKNQAFNFRITPELNEWLNEIAWKNRMSKSAYLTMLIEKDKEKITEGKIEK